MLLPIVAGWLLVGWVWGFMMVNRRAFREYVEDRYWGIVSKMIFNQYRQWVLTHPGTMAGCYHENKWNELRQNATETPEAQEECKKFINFVSRTVLLHSIFWGPVAILIDLKEKLRQRRQPKLTQTTL